MRSTVQTYLNEITIITDQNSADSAASTWGVVGASACGPLKASLKAYSGLVPMSPKTMPSAARVRAFRLDLVPWEWVSADKWIS
jgi:hypothetical protein